MKKLKQNRNKYMEIERFDWFIMDTNMRGFWLVRRTLRWKNLQARERSRNQSILCIDVMLQHDWPIKQCLLHIRVFFCRKTKSPRFDLFIHWLIKQMTNTYRNYFSRSYKNLSKSHVYNKRQTTDSSWVFLRIENKQIKTVQNNNYD